MQENQHLCLDAASCLSRLHEGIRKIFSNIHVTECPEIEHDFMFKQGKFLGGLKKAKSMVLGFSFLGLERVGPDEFDNFVMDSLDVFFTSTFVILPSEKIYEEATED